MTHLLRRLRKNISGVSAIEFAFIAPVLVLLLIGTFETGRLILLAQKVQNASFILSDLASRNKRITEAQILDDFEAIRAVMSPFDIGENGTAFLTSVLLDGKGEATINWQRKGAGKLEQESTLISKAQSRSDATKAVVIPELKDLPVDSTVIISEVFYNYSMFFGLYDSDFLIHSRSFNNPRLGELDRVQP